MGNVQHWGPYGFSYVIRWILKILHDPKDPKPWEQWYYSILRSCRTFSINTRGGEC